MVASDTTTTPPGPESVPAPTLALEVGEELLEHAKRVAQSITDRVRRTLAQGEPAEGSTRPLRVLCVDDHEDAADSLAAVLELLGCETRACYDGPSALAVVTEFKPDACLLDLSMPGMDGFELATLIKARAGSRPVLLAATTALGSLEDRTRTAIIGFHFHLLKPIDSDT